MALFDLFKEIGSNRAKGELDNIQTFPRILIKPKKGFDDTLHRHVRDTPDQ